MIFSFKRIQFFENLSFTVTINTAQRNRFPNRIFVIDLNKYCYKLYVEIFRSGYGEIQYTLIL